ELGAISLVLMYTFGWTIHVAFSHTLILSVGVLFTLWAMLRVVQEGRAGDYALLGAAIAFGLLAKYNFALFAVPLLIAACAVRETRAAMLNARVVMALVVTALLIAPHAVWLAGVSFDYAGTVADVTGVDEAGGYFARVGAGLGGVVLAF